MGGLPTGDVQFRSNTIISREGAGGLTDIAEIRINDILTPKLTLTTNNNLFKRRLQNYLTLIQTVGETDLWTMETNTGASNRSTCSPGIHPLNERIYHACGDPNAVHWIPSLDFTRLSGTEGNVLMNLWVRG